MKKALFVFVIAALSASSAWAAGTVQTSQQNRMKQCAAEYHQKNIAKAQYHAFMSDCLKKTHKGKASVGPISPQPKS